MDESILPKDKESVLDRAFNLLSSEMNSQEGVSKDPSIAGSLMDGLPPRLRGKLRSRLRMRDAVYRHHGDSVEFRKAKAKYLSFTIDILVTHWEELPVSTRADIWNQVKGFKPNSITELYRATEEKGFSFFLFIRKACKLLLSHPRRIFYVVFSLPKTLIYFFRDKSILEDYQESSRKVVLVFSAIKNSTSIDDVQFDIAALGLDVVSRPVITTPEQAKVVEHFPSEQSFQFALMQHRSYKEEWDNLKEKYLGQYILFEDGVVLDHGDEMAEIIRRDRERRGYRDIFVKHVSKVDPNTITKPLDLFL
ncbi:MAG: hypothetical protein WA902_07590 [Thermosynechococcaceae cyanobacterium]